MNEKVAGSDQSHESSGRPRSRGVLAALGVAVVVVAVLWWHGAANRPQPAVDTVVLVSIDSLRADHVGSYGYPKPTTPFLDGLARDGLRFERAYSTTSWTLPSHAAMLSGLFNDSHGAVEPARTIRPGVTMLAEALAGAGIHTTGFYSGPLLDGSYGFSRGFERYVSAASYAWKGIRSDELIPHAQSHADSTNPALEAGIGEWLASDLRPGRQFVFIHMWDVHYDYIPPKRYADLFDPDYTGSVDGRNYEDNPAINPDLPGRDLEHIQALYDGEIRYTDDTLARLVGRLRERGLLDNAAIVVTADHGDEFFEHGWKGHMWTLYEEVLHVPLLIKLYGASPAPSVAADVVSLLDLYPTICELFAVDCGYSGPGVSLVPYLRGDKPAGLPDAALAELTAPILGMDVDALVRRDDKIIRWNDRSTIRYYDLARDPRENAPLQLREAERNGWPEPASSIFDQMNAWNAEAAGLGERLRQLGEAGSPQLDEATREHLRSLGYIR